MRARTLVAATGVLLAVTATAAPATAEPRLSVSPASGLDPAGATVTVTGEGYDERKGIYVAWCVVPPPGEKPTPCGGGEDRDGSSGGSVWVSSFPPAYGLGLAQPYDGDGGFEVQISVSRIIATEDGDIDCFTTPCAVVTRNDHERTEDRSQDVVAPVTFEGQEGDPSTETAAEPGADTEPGTEPEPETDTTRASGATRPGTDDQQPATTSQPDPAAGPGATGEPTPTQRTTDGDAGGDAAPAVRSTTPRPTPPPQATVVASPASGDVPAPGNRGPAIALAAVLLALTAAGGAWAVRR